MIRVQFYTLMYDIGETLRALMKIGFRVEAMLLAAILVGCYDDRVWG